MKAEEGKDLHFRRAESAREQTKADKENSSTHCKSIRRSSGDPTNTSPEN
jgi:hypothetical protein